MLDGQLMLADTGRGETGIDDQVVPEIVERGRTRKGRAAGLLAEERLDLLARRQAQGRAIDTEQPEPVPKWCRPALPERLDRLCVEGGKDIVRQVLARLAESRP